MATNTKEIPAQGEKDEIPAHREEMVTNTKEIPAPGEKVTTTNSNEILAPGEKVTTTNSNEIPAPGEKVISKRACHIISRNDFLNIYALTAQRDPFHPERNPHGIINMGTALNRLMEDELQTYFQETGAVHYDRKFQHYYELFGVNGLRTAAAGFLTRHLCPERELDPENIVVLNGVASCLDALGHAICDPGDVLITATPVYARIFTNFCERACIDVRALETSQENVSEGRPFAFQPLDLEKKIQELLDEGKKVKGVILVHPHNPLGRFYSKPFLQEVLQICARYKLHVVVDEIYALSVYEDEENFVSTLAIHPAPDPQRLHFVWGLTKDLGLASFRVGFVHSVDKDVVACLRRISTYQCTPLIMQHTAMTLLNDKEWCDNFYLPTNRRKLRDASRLARSRLEDMGLVVLESKAGLFLWVNAQVFLSSATKEAEIELFDKIFKKGVYIVPGCQLNCVNPGWFRVIFSVNEDDLERGLARIRSVLEEIQIEEIERMMHNLSHNNLISHS